MPAKPLSPEQKQDAARLKEAFRAWQVERRDRKEPSSQADFAHLVGFGQSALSQYLNGQIPLNGETLWKFCELLKLAPEEISPDIAHAEIARSRPWIERAAPAAEGPDIVATNAAGDTFVIEVKRNRFVDSAFSSDDLNELVLAVLDLPPKKARDVLLKVMDDASEFRQYLQSHYARAGIKFDPARKLGDKLPSTHGLPAPTPPAKKSTASRYVATDKVVTGAAAPRKHSAKK